MTESLGPEHSEVNQEALESAQFYAEKLVQLFEPVYDRAFLDSQPEDYSDPDSPESRFISALSRFRESVISLPIDCKDPMIHDAKKFVLGYDLLTQLSRASTPDARAFDHIPEPQDFIDQVLSHLEQEGAPIPSVKPASIKELCDYLSSQGFVDQLISELGFQKAMGYKSVLKNAAFDIAEKHFEVMKQHSKGDIEDVSAN